MARLISSSEQSQADEEYEIQRMSAKSSRDFMNGKQHIFICESTIRVHSEFYWRCKK